MPARGVPIIGGQASCSAQRDIAIACVYKAADSLAMRALLQASSTHACGTAASASSPQHLSFLHASFSYCSLDRCPDRNLLRAELKKGGPRILAGLAFTFPREHTPTSICRCGRDQEQQTAHSQTLREAVATMICRPQAS